MNEALTGENPIFLSSANVKGALEESSFSEEQRSEFIVTIDNAKKGILNELSLIHI